MQTLDANTIENIQRHRLKRDAKREFFKNPNSSNWYEVKVPYSLPLTGNRKINLYAGDIIWVGTVHDKTKPISVVDKGDGRLHFAIKTRSGVTHNVVPKVQSGVIVFGRPERHHNADGDTPAPIAPTIQTTPAATGAKSSSDAAKQASLAIKNAMMPVYISVGVGMLIGLGIAHHKKGSGAEYVGYVFSGAIGGGVLGYGISKVLLGKQSSATTSLSSSGTGSGAPNVATTGVQSPTTTTTVATNNSTSPINDQINTLVDSIVSKNIKNAPVNTGNAVAVKAAIASSLSDHEKAILLDTLTSFDKLPNNPTDAQVAGIAPDLSALNTKYGADFSNLMVKLNTLTKTVS